MQLTPSPIFFDEVKTVHVNLWGEPHRWDPMSESIHLQSCTNGVLSKNIDTGELKSSFSPSMIWGPSTGEITGLRDQCVVALGWHLKATEA